ncbi:MAG: O-antigen ligase family protein [bacterium]
MPKTILTIANSWNTPLFIATVCVLCFLIPFIHPLLILIAAIALATFVLFLKKPILGIWLLLLFVPLGQFARLPISQQGAQEIAIMATDLLIPFLLLTWIIRKILVKEPFNFPKNSVIIIGFSATATISLAFAALSMPFSDILSGGLYLFRWLEFAALFFISWDLIRTAQQVKFLTWLFIGGGTVIAFLGFLQYLIFPDFSFMVEFGWDPHLERLVSTFFDPNFTGMYLVITLSLLLSIFYQALLRKPQPDEKKVVWHKSKKNKFITIILLLMLFNGLALILTYSRSAMLAFLLVLVVFGFAHDRKILILTAFSALIVLSFFPRYQERLTETFDPDTSANKRIESWSNATTILEDTNPFIGIGYNTYRSAQISYGLITDEELARSGAGTDSSLLLILVTTGIGGLILYLLILLRSLYLGLQTYLKNKNTLTGMFGLSFTAILIGLIVHSQFVNSLLYPFILLYFWIAFGVVTRFSNEIIPPEPNS